MEFTLIHENKLKVILSAADMERLALRYDEMDYSDESTRKALISILDQGRSRVRFNPRKAKLFIEVYPCDGGGCVLYFTCLGGGGGGGGGGVSPVLFAFDSVEDLTRGAAKAVEQYGHRIYRSALCRLDGRYHLIVYPLDYSDRLSVYFLSEYGHKIGEGELLAAFAEEHGQVLMEENAIETLSQLFGED